MSFAVGNLVAFKTYRGEIIKARVVKPLHYVPMEGERVTIKITSRKSSMYPMGLLYNFTPGRIWKRDN